MSARGALAVRAAPALAAAAALALACAWLPWREPEIRPWLEETERLRGLEFVEPVRLRRITSARTGELTRLEILDELSEGEVERYRDGYVALGLLPRGFDLLDAMLDLYEEQLIGFYSMRSRTLYVVEDQAEGQPGGHPAILVHELVHALQHQHFPETMELVRRLRRNDDVVTAAAAAIEGDASLAMLAIGEAGDGAAGRASAFDPRTPEAAEYMRESMRLGLTHPTGMLARVPRLLRVSLLFPYAEGVVMAARRWSEEGNAGLDALLHDPPLSTVRVRDPDDDDPVEFLRLPEELEIGAAARGCVPGVENVAGSLAIDVLLDDHGDAEPRDELLGAWSGDRFRAFACAEGPAFAWVTRWDDAARAEEFARRYRAIAPSIAERAGLAGEPEVSVQGRTVAIAAPELAHSAPALLFATESRAYGRFAEWVADDCFPESPCPWPR